MTTSEDATSVLATLASLLLAYFVYFNLKVFTFWSSRGVKGPMPWPIVGTNIYYFIGNKIDVDMKWREKYGKTYGTYDGFHPTLRTTDNHLLKQIYIKQFQSFTDRNNKFVHGDNMRRWLLFSPGELWNNQRALISPMFTSVRMRSMNTKMAERIDNFLDQLVHKRLQATAAECEKQLASSHPMDDELLKAKSMIEASARTVFTKQDLSKLTLDVIASSFFGLKLNFEKDKSTREFLKQAFEFGSIFFPWLICWMLIPAPIARYFKIDLQPYWKYKYLDLVCKQVIDERRKLAKQQGANYAKPNDFTQALLDAKIPDVYEKVYSEEDNREAHYNDQVSVEELERLQEMQTKESNLFRSFSEMEIRGQMTFLFIAGFETTATTLGFCAYELAHHPDYQEELFEELAAFKDRSIEYSDLVNLRKLDAFVSEVLRLYAPIIDNNRLVTRKGGVELEIWEGKTVHLPKGTSISTNDYVVHRDEDYFEEPLEFRPSRFYPENRDKISSCAYKPFGLGPRNCAGLRFALFEVRLALAKLIPKYLVSPGPNTGAYPPAFQRHAFFLQLEHSDFKLTPRGLTLAAN